MAKDHADADDLASKTPVELRAIARDLGIEGADYMTGAQAEEAIRAHKETDERS